MSLELILRFAHVIGAAVLFGTGAGIAFFMLMAHRSGNVGAIAHTARTVVLADFVFTATAVVLQPITGVLLAREVGWTLTEPWIAVSIGLYVFAGLLWLPVVWIQMRLRELAIHAEQNNVALGDDYHRLFRIWLLSGFPAFAAVLAIYWLMIARPQLW